MNLRSKRRMAANILKVGSDRVWLDPNRLVDIKEAITNDDLRKLMNEGTILVKQKKGISRSRFRKLITQKRKGRRAGPASKKGKATSRLGSKTAWVNRIRAQRQLFQNLLKNNTITRESYKYLKKKAKGGFFRSKRHIKLYLTEHNLWVNKK